MRPSAPGLLILAAVTLVAESAHALQPIEVFLEAARKTNPDTREARANTDTARAQSMVSVGRLLPGLSLRGTYSRNQYETAVTLPGSGGSSQTVTITPYDQFDGVATITVPLVNLADHWRADAGDCRRARRSGRKPTSHFKSKSAPFRPITRLSPTSGWSRPPSERLMLPRRVWRLRRPVFSQERPRPLMSTGPRPRSEGRCNSLLLPGFSWR